MEPLLTENYFINADKSFVQTPNEFEPGEN